VALEHGLELVGALVRDHHHRVGAGLPRVANGATERRLLGVEFDTLESARHRRLQGADRGEPHHADLHPAALHQDMARQRHFLLQGLVGDAQVGGEEWKPTNGSVL
jgi:hypothetical protein